ncbi:hypothetical protein PoB_006000200 [Plakobranchus ocellatus]|uniref:Helix-turn-helix domain-containing protein n=1 Tax=Plakobranchus ocellatus TaxID=259542 RepID=A0AAV4CNP3_9GAST|nr:hypothetical protein PoB_006000200 [Plakobranchus ocellatus]
MGTCMASSYANLFMGVIEEQLLGSSADKPLVWLRYIDDIFLIWTHGRPKLETFIKYANTLHPTIKFISIISKTNIPFLDVMVLEQNNTLQTDLYNKFTFNHLHWTPCHPQQKKRSTLYSLPFRLVRICSNSEPLQTRLEQLSTHLRSRGFPNRQIETAIKKKDKKSQTHQDTQSYTDATEKRNRQIEYHSSSHITPHCYISPPSSKDISQFYTLLTSAGSRYHKCLWQLIADLKT